MPQPRKHASHAARQAAYREILALRGKLRWDDAPKAASPMVAEPRAAYVAPKAAKSRGRKA